MEDIVGDILTKASTKVRHKEMGLRGEKTTRKVGVLEIRLLVVYKSN